VRIIGWLRRLDVDSLAEVCRARAEVPQRSPETIGDLARLLSDPESVAAAVDGLDRDAVLVAQSVVVLGDECEVARLRAFVRDPYSALRGPDRQDVVYAATVPAVMARSWKRVCMPIRRFS